MNSRTLLELRVLANLNPVGASGATPLTSLAERLSIPSRELEPFLQELAHQSSAAVKLKSNASWAITYNGKVRLTDLVEQLVRLIGQDNPTATY